MLGERQSHCSLLQQATLAFGHPRPFQDECDPSSFSSLYKELEEMFRFLSVHQETRAPSFTKRRSCHEGLLNNQYVRQYTPSPPSNDLSDTSIILSHKNTIGRSWPKTFQTSDRSLYATVHENGCRRVVSDSMLIHGLYDLNIVLISHKLSYC